MRKIPTLFKRDHTNHRLTSEYADGTEWVRNGEGIATRKYDGTAVLIRDGRMFKRYELKPKRLPPTGFEPVEKDETTGKTVGWVPVGDGPADKWYHQAIYAAEDLSDGTYELLGPEVQGNPEGCEWHCLLRHDAADVFHDVPTAFDALREWFVDKDIEGIVWHHPDGRMAKIKKKDFGLKRTSGPV